MTDIRQTRRSLWLVAQGFINVLASIFGRSEEIAARHTKRAGAVVPSPG